MDKLSQISELLMQAVHDDALYDQAMEGLRVAFGASNCFLHTPLLPMDSLSSIWTSPGISASDIEIYAAHYSKIDVWRVSMENMPYEPGVIIWRGYELVDDKDLLKSELYNDLNRSLGLFQLLVAQISDSNALFPLTYVSLFREEKMMRFSDSEAVFYQQVTKKIQLSLALRQLLINQKQHQRQLEGLINTNKAPTVLLDRSAKIIAANDSAEKFFSDSAEFHVKDKSLVASDNTIAAQLERALHQASIGPNIILEDSNDTTEVGTRIIVHTAAKKHPYCLHILPLAQSNTVLGQFPVAVAYIIDPQLAYSQSTEVLKQCLGLTISEAFLCLQLLHGNSIKQAAQALKITEGSARQRLKTVFNKTKTHSQPELMRLLLSYQ